MPQKRLIVYDLDGTLADTVEDIAEAANHMLSQVGDAPVSAQEIRRYVGRGVYQLVKDCLGTEDPSRVDAGLAIYRRYYRQHLLDHTRLYPLAEDVLKYFGGRAQAVITNKPNPYSREILVGLGVADYFVEIIGGDAPYPRKPDPTSLRAVLEQIGVPPADALFIGDSPVDVATGRSAGVLTVTVLHGLAEEAELRAAGAELMVRDFRALLELAKREGW